MSDPRSAEEALDLYVEARARGEPVDSRSFASRFPQFGPELRLALEAFEGLAAAAPAPPAQPTPQRVGAFRVVREVGRGGMGVVLEAHDEQLGRRVALKLLPPELAPSPSARARFRREAELAGRLDHPGIATVYGAGVADGHPWIAMRFVEGRTLARSIAEARDAGARGARLGPALEGGRAAALRVAACLAQVARALHFAHERGVVHRDVKPSNVVVRPDGTPVLLDFGLAIGAEIEDVSLTRTGDTPGTPNYLAPEVVDGSLRRPDVRCDVYALGVALYECLTLSKPFDAPTPSALYRAILSAAVPDVRTRNRDVPRDLAVVVATAIERDRARRYRDAAALASDLEAVAAGRPIAARPVPLAGRVARWARREPRQALLASALAAATVGVATFGGTWWASRDEVHAAERIGRARAVEEALGDGWARLSLEAPREAEAAFARALELDPANVEALVGRVVGGLEFLPREAVRERLARVPADVRGRDALAALVEGRPLPAPRERPSLEGATALELGILGLCWHAQARRVPASEQPAVFATALRCFTEAILRSPVARPMHYEHRALAAQRARDAEAARSAATSLLALWPDSPRSLYVAGSALSTIDPALGRRCLERSVELKPWSLDAYTMLAVACFEQQDLEAAEAWCWRGLARDPRDAKLHYWVGQSLTFRDCLPEAGEAYRRSFALDPAHPGIVKQLALHELLDRQDRLAVELYRYALALDPADHRARLFGSAAAELAGDPSSDDHLDAAVAGLYPADVGFWRQSAWVMSQLGAHASCVGAADAGLALDPSDRGLVELREGALAALAARR